MLDVEKARYQGRGGATEAFSSAPEFEEFAVY